MLFFKRKFLGKIESGEKRQTIRYWSRARVKAGQAAFVPGLGGSGRVRIIAVERVKLGALRRKDAEADGFKTRKEMMEELREIYPRGRGAGMEVYRVRFEMMWDGRKGRGENHGRHAGEMKSESSVRTFKTVRQRRLILASYLQLHRNPMGAG